MSHCCEWLPNLLKTAAAQRVYSTARTDGFVITTRTRGALRRQSMVRSGASGPLAAPGLCTHLWNHYEFSGDKEFLRALIRSSNAAQFFHRYSGRRTQTQVAGNVSFSISRRMNIRPVSQSARGRRWTCRFYETFSVSASMLPQILGNRTDFCAEASISS